MPRILLVSVSLCLSLPAFAAMVNLPPVVDAVDVSSAPVPPASSVTITCAAHDTDGSVVGLKVTVSGGSLPSGGVTETLAITAGATVSGTVVWTTPAAGAYSITCDANDSGGLFGGSAVGTLAVPVTVQAVVGAPVVDTLSTFDLVVAFGTSTTLAAAAHDPDGGPLTFAWTATGGALTTDGDRAVWTAPNIAGVFQVTLTVTDSAGLTGRATVSLSAAPERFTQSMTAAVVAPRRVVAAPGGDLFVVDGSSGALTLVTPRGEVKATFSVPDVALSATACFGQLLVGTQSGRVLALDPQGRPRGDLALQTPAAWPAALACDADRGLLYIAERNAGRVRAVWADGSTAFAHTQAGLDALSAPVDVAVDTASRRLWVLVESWQDGTRNQVHGFTLDGVYATSLAPFGGGQGKVTRGAGLAVNAAGRLYVADAFQGTVQVFDVAGVSLGAVGSFGTGPGNLLQPSGLAITARGDLVVANTGAARLDVFGDGTPLPACLGDVDCDGLPDAWELAFGLNPNDPRDALVDPDADGLTNAEELAWGTNPRNGDSDGDGFTDGDEVARGLSPLDPADHRPTLAVDPVTSDPGLVLVDGRVDGLGTCSVGWRQLSGPAVGLRSATSTTLAFVARTAGVYQFEGTPRCDAAVGPPTVAEVRLREVPPRADPGRVTAVGPGDTLRLDGAFSRDPNGGVLSLTWDQLLGPARLGTTKAPATSVRLYQAGLYTFALTAEDGVGLSDTAELPVVVVEPSQTPLTAMATTPVLANVGTAVALDASESLAPAGAPRSYVWRQRMGPPVVLAASATAQPSFVPAVPGHYRFDVAVLASGKSSPPQVVDLYVAPAGGPLPVAVAPARVTGPVGEPVRLDGSASRPATAGAGLSWHWRQVFGPAAGLTHADTPHPTVVPFEAGSYLFELAVREGEAESPPAFVRLDADVSGRVRPVAIADAPAVATAQSEVVLDAQASTGTRYRWTQVAGPWVALDDPRAPVASFRPTAAGLYGFELEVDDGSVRSAPVTVNVLVFPQVASGGQP